MSKKPLIKSVQNVLTKHSPEILTGLGISGMVATTVLAVKATPRAINLIQEDSRIKHDGDPYAYTKKEAIQSAWKCYIPAATTGALSVACLIGASSVNATRNAALATAYTISETALSEYRSKVIETIGEKKEKTVREAVAKEKIINKPPVQKEIIVTGNGKTLCFETMGGRYFKSDMETLRRVQNDLNRRMRDEITMSLNDFYYEIGLDETDVGKYIGWDIDKGYIEIDFSSQLTDDGTPCLVVGFITPPQWIY